MYPGCYALSDWGACILGVEGLTPTSEERKFFAKTRPFGFILFARNIENLDQVRDLCQQLREAAGHNAPILIDQEGGRVQRLRAPQWREWLPPFEQVAAAKEHAEEVLYIRYRIIAHELYEIGIDANCAPLLDVPRPSTHEFLYNRCYSENIENVSKLGLATANGLADGGVLSVAKHIPGHGRATVDSHFDLPRVDEDLETLLQTDFVPFKALNDLPMGMTAHVVYSDLDDKPATLSSTVMNIIREDIGFDGLIMTDDISMKALQGDLCDLSKQSRDAGCDVILHCNGKPDEARQVAEAAGYLEGESLRRAKAALATRKDPQPVDIPALEAKLDQLLNGCKHV
ncbi:MAG: beta-N-acetylhexosaminidase [Pseudomonadota bacterium]